jgi:hypothetical protein
MPRCGVRLFSLATLALVTLGSSGTCAQSLMVGADGAVHLDEMSESAASAPVIIEQTPQLIQPQSISGMSMNEMPFGNMPMTGMPMGAPGCPQPMSACIDPCTVPFVPCAPCTVPCVQPPMPIKYSFFGEFLYLHPTGVDMAHAQQQNGIGGAGTVPFGYIGATDFHHEPGVKIGGDMAVSCTTSIAATYTWFESNAVSSVYAPTIPGGGGAVGSLVHHPGAAVTASVGEVHARSVLDFQLADAEYRMRLRQGPCYWINSGVGLRFANLEQNFGQTGVFSGGQGGAIDTQSDIDFNGGGLKVGIDGGRNLGNRGFSVYGRAGVSPLVGEFNSRYTMYNNSTATLLAQADWNDDRFVTLLDYEVGIAWSGPRRRWRFSTGYTATHWFNAVTTASFIDNVQANNYVGGNQTISFDGLTARVEHLW